MSVITTDDLKAHLNVTGDDDDALLSQKIEAAEAWIERFVGSALDDAEAFPDGTPAPLKEAVRQLAAHLYENREATITGEAAREIPFGVHDLIFPYRQFAF